ncbi:hypothetical protein [Actinokineospora inagensis]|uniref:hypothetical protein n=1 Tax=Actinokineospora inagensis TaxID=103730 RepID=UPI000414A314|nr:hypothetical protein [Actinokineospora inagensis]
MTPSALPYRSWTIPPVTHGHVLRTLPATGDLVLSGLGGVAIDGCWSSMTSTTRRT